MAESLSQRAQQPLPGAAGPGAKAISSISLGRDCAYQAYRILQVAFVVAPIVAGTDKFFNSLTEWSMYLAPGIASRLNIGASTLMRMFGIVEIVAGIVVAVWPRVGAYVITLWLWGTIVDLLMTHGFYDVALRDLGLSLGALALARLSQRFHSKSYFP